MTISPEGAVPPSVDQAAARLAALTYPDVSVLGRLTDTAPALAAEIAAVRRLFRMVAAGRLRLLSSEILTIETGALPPDARRRRLRLLRRAVAVVPIAGTEETARRLQTLGFHAADALHVAAAYTGGADYAVSCDGHFLRRAARTAAQLGPRPVICTPLECLRREGLL